MRQEMGLRGTVKELRASADERMQWLKEDEEPGVEEEKEEDWDFELQESEEELEELVARVGALRKLMRSCAGIDELMRMVEEMKEQHGEDELREERSFLMGKRRGLEAGGDGGKRLVGY